MSAGNLKDFAASWTKQNEMSWPIICEGDYTEIGCIVRENTWCHKDGSLTSNSQWCRDKCKCSKPTKRSDDGSGSSNRDINDPFNNELLAEYIAEQMSRDHAHPSTLFTVTMSKTAAEGAEPTEEA